MGKLKIAWTLQAKNQLKLTYQYYKEKAGTKVAQKIKNEILYCPEILKTHPKTGQEEETLSFLQEGHRYLVQGNYKIIYKLKDNTAHVTDVFDSRQDPQKLKKNRKK